jgi:hypothetical protein
MGLPELVSEPRMVTVGHWKGSAMDHEWLFKDK